jgi:hypothetical protein
MAVSPVERIIGNAFVENVFDVVAGALVISDCWKERGLAQQVFLDSEEYRPLRAVVAVLWQSTEFAFS